MSAADGRRFGLTVGGAFVVLAALLWWRGHGIGSTVAGAAGVTLCLGGVLVPAHLGPVRHGWTRVGAALSKVTTPVVLGVLYFGLLTPFGLVRRMFGRDSLRRVRRQPSFWVLRGPAGGRRSDLRRQF